MILGDHDVSTTAEIPAMMRAVSSIIRHKSFDADTFNHDIALLKLRKPVEFTKHIRPVCLPKCNILQLFLLFLLFSKKLAPGILN